MIYQTITSPHHALASTLKQAGKHQLGSRSGLYSDRSVSFILFADFHPDMQIVVI